MLSTRYTTAFHTLQNAQRMGFCPFAVLGAPNEGECLQRIDLYLKNGADMLELGIPFSDPVADGPVVAAADEQALAAGITTKKCIALIKKIRTRTAVPIGILCYANTVHAYGIQQFYSDLAAAGADSVLIADCPPEELTPFADAAHKAGIHQICIVTQNTTAERLTRIEQFSTAFLYVVATLGVTGARNKLNPTILKTIKFLKTHTKIPLAIGFGISKKEHLEALKKAGADCGIVGSYLVQAQGTELVTRLGELTKL